MRGSACSGGIRSRPMIPNAGLHDRVHQIDQGTRASSAPLVTFEKKDLIRSSMKLSETRERAAIVSAFSCAIFSGHALCVQVPVLTAVGEDLTAVSVYAGQSRSWQDLVANVPPRASFASEMEEIAVVMSAM